MRTSGILGFLLLITLGALAWAIHDRVHRPIAATTDSMSTATGPAKKLWHCGMHPQVIQDHPGDCPICHMALTPIATAAADAAERKILYWWDPMLGPSSMTDHPGKSAMGMDLVPVYGTSAGPGVTIDPTLAQNMGVRTAPVTRGPLSKTIRAVGMLKLPEPGLHDVSLKVGGWIDRLYTDQEGMHVKQGDPLFALYSQDLQVAEQELISAVKSEKSLGPDAGENLRREARSLVDSATRKLRLWDVADADIQAIAKADEPPRTIIFRSPATGHIEDKMIVQGSAVQPMMKLMRVAEHSQIWLEAQVYQEQIPAMKLDQEAAITVEGMPEKTWKGRLTFIAPHLDHMNRTLTVRMTLDNPGFVLRPGMYATAEFLTAPLADVIQAPREAVIDTGTRQLVFVAGPGHQFIPRDVQMGVSGDGDRVQILRGLQPGETVVTSGQFLLDVESRTIEATRKLNRTPAEAMPASQPSSQPATHPAMREGKP